MKNIIPKDFGAPFHSDLTAYAIHFFQNFLWMESHSIHTGFFFVCFLSFNICAFEINPYCVNLFYFCYGWVLFHCMTSLFFLHTDRHLDCLQLLAIIGRVVMCICIVVFVWEFVSFPLCKYLGVEWLGGMISAMEMLSQESTYFPKVLGNCIFLGATHDHSSLLPLLAVLVIASHSVLAILLNVYWLSHHDFIFIFLKTNDRY